MTDLVRKRVALVAGADALVAAAQLRGKASEYQRLARLPDVSPGRAREALSTAEICERVARSLEEAV